MKKPRGPYRKSRSLSSVPRFTFDFVKQVFARKLKDRYEMVDDAAIRAVYSAMLGWHPWFAADQQSRERPNYKHAVQANRDLDRQLKSLQQIREHRAREIALAEEAGASAERALLLQRLEDEGRNSPPADWELDMAERMGRNHGGAFAARLALQEIDERIARARDSRIPLDPGIGWDWLWEALPVTIEAAIRTSNPQFPRSGKRTKGAERGPSAIAEIMACLILPLTGEKVQSAATLERTLQRLRQRNRQIVDMRDAGQTSQQIAPQLGLDVAVVDRVLRSAGLVSGS
jgi:hypothetical protein